MSRDNIKEYFVAVINEKFSVNTEGHFDIIDITKKVENCLNCHPTKDATVIVSVAGSTASITTIEYEPGLLKDLPNALNKIAPEGAEYFHDETWHDGNGNAHVLASIMGSSITIPVIDGILFLGTWQQIVLIDFDNKSRHRTICVQILQ